MKKILIFVIFLFSFVLYANENRIPVNYNNTEWDLSIPASKTYAGIIYLPKDIDYSRLQNSIANDNNITVYTIFTMSSQVKGLTGRKMLASVLITKNDIKYKLVDYGENGDSKTTYYYSTFDELNETVDKLNIPYYKDWLKSKYIGYLDKIHKNAVYYVKATKGLSFSLLFGNPDSQAISQNGTNISSQATSSSQGASSSQPAQGSSSSEANAQSPQSSSSSQANEGCSSSLAFPPQPSHVEGNSTSSSGLVFPPSPPTFESSSSSNINGLETPPTPPTLHQ
jgi:hypothetical protein